MDLQTARQAPRTTGRSSTSWLSLTFSDRIDDPSGCRKGLGSCNESGGWLFRATRGSVLLALGRIDGSPEGGDPMDFPIHDLLDRAACREKLLDLLHPDGLA